MDLEAAIDQVYAATPDDFMSVRTALVTEAKQAKERDLAKSIGALRKPTRSAWMINLLARSAAEEVESLLELGAALREAQASLSGPELRRLSSERQKAVAALVRRAGSLAGEVGHRATDAQLQEVSQHLQAALADPDLAEDVRRGRVTQIVTFGGFGPWEVGAAPSESARAGAARAGSDRPGSDQAGSDQPQQDRTRPAAAVGSGGGEDGAEVASAPPGPSAAEIQAARDAWKQTRAAVKDARAELADASSAAEEAAAAVGRLRAELAEAERSAAAADVRRQEAEDRLAPLGRRPRTRSSTWKSSWTDSCGLSLSKRSTTR